MQTDMTDVEMDNVVQPKKPFAKVKLLMGQGGEWKQRILSETSSFLASNLLYSASTYLVGFLIPYLLNTDYMAFYTSGTQILLVLSSIFEFGFSMSFLRFYQLDKSVKYINGLLQLVLFGLIMSLGLFLSKYINVFFNIHYLPVDTTLFYFLIIAQLSWIFIKNWFLAVGKLKLLIVHSATVLVLRMAALVHLYYIKDFSITTLFIETLLLPFLPTLTHLLIINLSAVFQSLYKYSRSGYSRSGRYFSKLKEYVRYSLLIHVSGIIYLYTVRYLIIYLTGKDNTAVADMGYAMTFIGAILVFYTSFRGYLLARLNMNDIKTIDTYLKKLFSSGKYFLIIALALSALFSYIVYLIKPQYLTLNSVIFSYILFLSNFLNFYLGLFTLLSKTMDYNKLELGLNIIRFLLVAGITHTVIKNNLVTGVVLINLSMVFIEFIFSKIVVRRIRYAHF